jgi:hypothetical protein
MAKKIAKKQKEYVVPRIINKYRHRAGLKSFHIIPKPLKSESHISDRLWMRDWLKEWTEEDKCYCEIVKDQACIGIFVMFTCKRLLRIIKDNVQS